MSPLIPTLIEDVHVFPVFEILGPEQVDPVPFLIDTGASGVSLPSEVVAQIGIPIRPDTPRADSPLYSFSDSPRPWAMLKAPTRIDARVGVAASAARTVGALVTRPRVVACVGPHRKVPMVGGHDNAAPGLLGCEREPAPAAEQIDATHHATPASSPETRGSARPSRRPPTPRCSRPETSGSRASRIC